MLEVEARFLDKIILCPAMAYYWRHKDKDYVSELYLYKQTMRNVLRMLTSKWVEGTIAAPIIKNILEENFNKENLPTVGKGTLQAMISKGVGVLSSFIDLLSKGKSIQFDIPVIAEIDEYVITHTLDIQLGTIPIIRDGSRAILKVCINLDSLTRVSFRHLWAVPSRTTMFADGTVCWVDFNIHTGVTSGPRRRKRVCAKGVSTTRYINSLSMLKNISKLGEVIENGYYHPKPGNYCTTCEWSVTCTREFCRETIGYGDIWRSLK